MVTQLIAKDFPPLLHAFFCRPAEVVGPDLVGCRLVKRQDNGAFFGRDCGNRGNPGRPRLSWLPPPFTAKRNAVCPPGRFYVYVSYGIHHCVNVVAERAEWANGVLLRLQFFRTKRSVAAGRSAGAALRGHAQR